MTLQTRSMFRFGWLIDISNFYLDFEIAAVEYTATLRAGSYSSLGFCNEISRALLDAYAATWAVSIDADTRVITITCSESFIPLTVGTHAGTSGWYDVGFSEDPTTATTQVGDIASGKEYRPQFYLNDVVDFDDYQEATHSSVNVSASGQVVEVISFGNQNFMECNITFANNHNDIISDNVIEPSSTGVDDLREFMKWCVQKRIVEYYPDRTATDTFTTCILEKTAFNKDGTGFKLKELYDKGLVGYFTSDKLTFRKVV